MARRERHPGSPGDLVAAGPHPPEQHQERGLEGVVGVGAVTQQPAADAQHHRPVPADDGGERLLVAVAGEQVEQLAVGPLGGGSPQGA